jgi:hypothetical protein
MRPQAAVLTALGATFPNDAEAWHERARWAMAQAAAGRQQEEAAEAAATRVYEDGVAAAPSVALYDFFTEFLMQRRRMAADAGDAQRAEALQQRATAALAAAAAAGLRSPSAAVRHADALVAVGDVAAAAAVLTAVCESDVSHGGCTSEAAWGARLRLAARTAAAQSTAGADRTSEDLVAAVGRLCVRALRTVPPAQASPLWAQAMQLHTALRLDAAPLLALLESQLTATCTPLGDVAAMAVEWLSLHAGLEQARRVRAVCPITSLWSLCPWKQWDAPHPTPPGCTPRASIVALAGLFPSGTMAHMRGSITSVHATRGDGSRLVCRVCVATAVRNAADAAAAVAGAGVLRGAAGARGRGGGGGGHGRTARLLAREGDSAPGDGGVRRELDGAMAGVGAVRARGQGDGGRGGGGFAATARRGAGILASAQAPGGAHRVHYHLQGAHVIQAGEAVGHRPNSC